MAGAEGLNSKLMNAEANLGYHFRHKHKLHSDLSPRLHHLRSGRKIGRTSGLSSTT